MQCNEIIWTKSRPQIKKNSGQYSIKEKSQHRGSRDIKEAIKNGSPLRTARGTDPTLPKSFSNLPNFPRFPSLPNLSSLSRFPIFLRFLFAGGAGKKKESAPLESTLQGGDYLLFRFRSTIGVIRFNFSVRNGKRWNPYAMFTLVSLLRNRCPQVILSKE